MARSLEHGVTSGEDIQLGGVLGTPQVNKKTAEADEKGQSFHFKTRNQSWCRADPKTIHLLFGKRLNRTSLCLHNNLTNSSIISGKTTAPISCLWVC